MVRRVALLIIMLFFPSTIVLAEGSHVVINKIQISGSKSTDEFIEISNPSSIPVNLAGWRLSKKTATGNLYNLVTTFPEIQLPSQSSIVVAHKDFSGSAELYYSTSTSIAVDNTVILFSDAGKTVVDKVGLGKAIDFEGAPVPNPGTKEVIERTLFTDTDNNLADFKGEAVNEGGDEITEIFFDLQITEIMPNPVGADSENEWVEILNRGERTDMGGLALTDKKGSVKKYTFPLGSFIEKGSYIIVNSRTSGISLNNDGDVLEILTPFGAVLDSSEVDYGNSKEGLSYALVENEWFWTTTPTPGGVNKITAEPEETQKKTTAQKSTAKKSVKKATPKKSSSKKAGEVLGAVNESPEALNIEKEQMAKNDRLFGIILIVVASVGGVLYTFYINKEKLVAVFDKERRGYKKTWESFCRKIKRR